MNINLKKLEKELKALGSKEVFSRSLETGIKKDLFTRIEKLEQAEAPRVTFWNLPRTIISVPATLLTMIVIFVVGMTTQTFASNSRPGEFLFGFRILAEQSDLLLTFDAEAKVEKKVEIASTRVQFLAEAEVDGVALESVLQETRLALASATKAVAELKNVELLANVRDLVAEQESLLNNLARNADDETREQLAMVSQEIKAIQQENLILVPSTSEPNDEETALAGVATVFSGRIGTAYGQPTLFLSDGSHYVLVVSIDAGSLIGQDDVLVYGLVIDEKLVVERIFINNKLVETPKSDQEG